MDDRTDAALTDWIRSAGRLGHWEPGTPIIQQGADADCVVLIRTGRVKVVSRTPGGRQVLMGVRSSGDVLGEFSALDGRPRSADVLALTRVEGWVVSSAHFAAHVAESPGFATALLRVLVRRMREADLRRLEFGSLGTTSRIAAVLGGANLEHGSGTWIPLTQSDVGESVGASREATVKALARLRRAGIVETGRGRVRVLRPEMLARVAEDSDVLPPYRSSPPNQAAVRRAGERAPGPVPRTSTRGLRRASGPGVAVPDGPERGEHDDGDPGQHEQRHHPGSGQQ